MGAIVKFVTPEDAEILNKYLTSDGVVLVYQAMHEETEALGVENNDDVEYDFSEADILVDVVTDPDHYFMLCMHG